jgi:hypothetical protein
MVDNVESGQEFFRVLRYLPVNIISKIFHIHSSIQMIDAVLYGGSLLQQQQSTRDAAKI